MATESNMVFLDNASASLTHEAALEKHLEYLGYEAKHGGMQARAEYSSEIQNFYTEAGKMIGCMPNEIAFVQNATSGWAAVLNALSLQPGDEIILHETEFLSNYMLAQTLADKTGVKIVWAESDPLGRVDTDTLPKLFSKKTKLVSIVHIPAHTGIVNPVEEIGRIAKAHGVPFFIDAAQSVGHLDLSDIALHCDFLVGTSRKFLRGPRGAGILYCSNSIIDRLRPASPDLVSAKISDEMLSFNSDASRFESNERPFAAQVALSAAIKGALDLGQTWIEQRIADVASTVKRALTEIEGLRHFGDPTSGAGIITFQPRQMEARELHASLLERGVVSMLVPARASLNPKRQALGDSVRFSVHYFNQEEDIQTAVCAIKEVLES